MPFLLNFLVINWGPQSWKGMVVHGLKWVEKPFSNFIFFLDFHWFWHEALNKLPPAMKHIAWVLCDFPWQVQIWDGNNAGRARFFKFLRVRCGFKICWCWAGSDKNFNARQTLMTKHHLNFASCNMLEWSLCPDSGSTLPRLFQSWEDIHLHRKPCSLPQV